MLSIAEPLDINCADLPSAAPQDALPLMDEECRRYYANLEPLPPERVLPARSHLSILDGHYGPFIRKTVGIGMVNFWHHHELSRFRRFIVNGVFVLAKAGKETGASRSQRVILDARPGNANV